MSREVRRPAFCINLDLGVAKCGICRVMYFSAYCDVEGFAQKDFSSCDMTHLTGLTGESSVLV